MRCDSDPTTGSVASRDALIKTLRVNFTGSTSEQQRKRCTRARRRVRLRRRTTATSRTPAALVARTRTPHAVITRAWLLVFFILCANLVCTTRAAHQKNRKTRAALRRWLTSGPIFNMACRRFAVCAVCESRCACVARRCVVTAYRLRHRIV